MNETALQEEPTIEFDDCEFEINLDETEVDQRDVIFKSLENVINLDDNMRNWKIPFIYHEISLQISKNNVSLHNMDS